MHDNTIDGNKASSNKPHDPTEWGRTHRRYLLNDTAFDNINTEQSAYWLGYLYADGWHNRKGTTVHLKIQQRDAYMLDRFRDFLATDRPLKTHPARVQMGPHGKPISVGVQVQISISSVRISDALLKWGLRPAKTFDLDFPHWLPEPYMAHFIRGFFDGDGTLGAYKGQSATGFKYSAGFVGYAPFLSAIRQHLEEVLMVDFIQYQPAKNPKTHILRIEGRKQVIKFCEYIYQDSTVYLARKRDRFNSMLADEARLYERPRGERAATRTRALEVYKLVAEGKPYVEIARDLSVSPSVVSRIALGRRWSGVTGQLAAPVKLLLSIEQVKEIAELALSGRSIRKIAKQYDINHVTVYNIKMGRSWGEVTGIELQAAKGAKGGHNPAAKLNEEKVLEIRKLLLQGVGATEIAKKYGVLNYAIWAIKRGATWKHVQLPDPAV